MSSALTFEQFVAQRQHVPLQYFTHPQGKATVLVFSHIWWTDLIAYAVYANGYNVLVGLPPYLLYTDDQAYAQFGSLYQQWVAQIKKYNVAVMIGGNSAAMAPHHNTGVMLHDAAGVKLVNYWWDEPRTCPAYAKRLGLGPEDFIGHLKNPATLNVIWDIDVLEELTEFQGITNTLHVPLATLPEYWPQRNIPLKDRPLACCFLGNCHFNADYADTSADPFVTWANKVVAVKIANLDGSMARAMAAAGTAPASTADDPWTRAFWSYEVLNAVYMHRTRNLIVQAASKFLQGNLALIGAGWDKMGLRANAAHAGPNTGHVYASTKTSLNLFGGCVHGGMPLRPFDIAASFGLILTHYNRELPGLFEPGSECLAFRNADELREHLAQVLADPASYDKVVIAGHARAFKDHSWVSRMAGILARVGV